MRCSIWLIKYNYLLCDIQHRNYDRVMKEVFEQYRNDIFPRKCHLKAFLWVGCWELSSFKHYCTVCHEGTCRESCHRNQACYNQKDKHGDLNLNLLYKLLQKKCLFSHQPDMLQVKGWSNPAAEIVSQERQILQRWDKP